MHLAQKQSHLYSICFMSMSRQVPYPNLYPDQSPSEEWTMEERFRPLTFHGTILRSQLVNLLIRGVCYAENQSVRHSLWVNTMFTAQSTMRKCVVNLYMQTRTLLLLLTPNVTVERKYLNNLHMYKSYLRYVCVVKIVNLMVHLIYSKS